MGSIDGIEIGRVNIIGFHREVNLFPIRELTQIKCYRKSD